jgi:hypothetical protein
MTILAAPVLDDYVTLFQVYEHVINPVKLRGRIADGERRFASDGRRLIVDSRTIHARPELEAWGWQPLAGDEGWTYWSAECRRTLDDLRVTYRIEVPGVSADEALAGAVCGRPAVVRAQLDADEPKLRTSIVEGVSVFLSLFDDNPEVKHAFCSPKATYDPAANPDWRHGVPLPPIRELIEQGKVLALKLPDRHEHRARPGARRDVEAGFSAGRARPSDADEYRARSDLAPDRVPLR